MIKYPFCFSRAISVLVLGVLLAFGPIATWKIIIAVGVFLLMLAVYNGDNCNS